ncbi:MAG: thioredoxin family protein [Opitutaceae bacterium]|jgi:hypothetical protein
MYKLLLLAIICALGSPGLIAQSLATDAAKNNGNASTVVTKAADDDASSWTALQGQVQNLLPKTKAGGDPASADVPADDATAAPDAATLIATADLYKDFYVKNPTSKNAPIAKSNEAQALIAAERLGDKTQHTRAEALVSSLRKDASLPADSRYVVAANWDHLPLGAPAKITPEILAQIEKIERQLLKEFPELPNGYEALLCLANSTSDDEAKRLAQDLDKKDTPDWIRKEAKAILARQKLLGKDLMPLLVSGLGKDPVASSLQGKMVVAYSWATTNPVGMEQIRDLAKLLPSDAVFIGICVDPNIPRAKAENAQKALPGTQFYDPSGPNGALAGAMRMTFPHQIYMADAQGIIRSVTLQIDTEQKLQTLLAK